MPPFTYARVESYIASLPGGLAAYPTCVQKGSIVRHWLTGSPRLRHASALPVELRTLVDTLPLPSAWVSEVHANALYLALCDEHFPDDERFVEHSYRLNVALFRSPVYRALTAVSSSASFLHALRMGWRLFRQGTSLAMVPMGEREMKIRLTYPPLVVPEVVARCFTTSFRSALECTNTVGARAEMTSYDRNAAVYLVSW